MLPLGTRAWLRDKLEHADARIVKDAPPDPPAGSPLGTRRPADLPAYFVQVGASPLPPLGYRAGPPSSALSVDIDPALVALVHEPTGILVAEPLDLSSPGELRCWTFHYTSARVYQRFRRASSSPRPLGLGGWLRGGGWPRGAVDDPSRLCDERDGSNRTLDHRPCILTTPEEPHRFADKEGVAASLFGTPEQRAGLYGPGGEMERLRGWTWTWPDGSPSPLGHHLTEVCVPIRADAAALHRVPAHAGVARSVHLLAPPDARARAAAGPPPPLGARGDAGARALLAAVADDDAERAAFHLLRGDAAGDASFAWPVVPRDMHGLGALHIAARTGGGVALFRALEACGARYGPAPDGTTPLETALSVRNAPLFRELLGRGPTKGRWPQAQDGDLVAAVGYAALLGRLDMLEALLSKEGAAARRSIDNAAGLAAFSGAVLDVVRGFARTRGWSLDGNEAIGALYRDVADAGGGGGGGSSPGPAGGAGTGGRPGTSGRPGRAVAELRAELETRRVLERAGGVEALRVLSRTDFDRLAEVHAALARRRTAWA